ncbi:MAG TPA: UbiD family decarboxylase [Thermoplasmatales archaeon]|nr:UbiD family decarboxylase [Thermoplasmatales archaeon]
MLFRELIEKLDEKGLLIRIKKAVDVKYEISTIMKMLDGKPLLFKNVKGYDMPVAANVCSTRELVAIGLDKKKEELLQALINALENPKPPEVVSTSDYKEMQPDLSKLPILTYYPFDGGPYIASGIVVINDEEYGLNASYHRAMIVGKNKMVFRILPRDFNTYIERGNKEFAFCIGNPMSVLIASAVSIDVDKSELDIANALCPIKLVELDGHKVPEAEIVIIAEITDEMHDEGPFLDLTETPDIVRKQRVAKVKKLFVRENPIFHALLPGGLEHKTLMGMPREPTIYKEVSKVCRVKDVYITPGGCSWLHGAVSIIKKAEDDGKKAIEAAFKGHKSMKHVFVVDDDIDIHDPHQIEWAMATRFQGDKDMVIKKEKGSSLDPSSDLETRMTTKIGFDLTIPWGRDKKDFQKPDLPMKINLKEYL